MSTSLKVAPTPNLDHPFLAPVERPRSLMLRLAYWVSRASTARW